MSSSISAGPFYNVGESFQHPLDRLQLIETIDNFRFHIFESVGIDSGLIAAPLAPTFQPASASIESIRRKRVVSSSNSSSLTDFLDFSAMASSCEAVFWAAV
jgi:hypothetical protein